MNIQSPNWHNFRVFLQVKHIFRQYFGHFKLRCLKMRNSHFLFYFRPFYAHVAKRSLIRTILYFLFVCICNRNSDMFTLETCCGYWVQAYFCLKYLPPRQMASNILKPKRSNLHLTGGHWSEVTWPLLCDTKEY